MRSDFFLRNGEATIYDVCESAISGLVLVFLSSRRPNPMDVLELCCKAELPRTTRENTDFGSSIMMGMKVSPAEDCQIREVLPPVAHSCLTPHIRLTMSSRL